MSDNLQQIVESSSRPGIYAIVNLKTKQLYVGSSVNLRARVSRHYRLLQENRHSNQHLQNSWNKHGSSAFVVRVLEFCIGDDLLLCEQSWIDCYISYKKGYGYNICPTAGSTRGIQVSVETREKHRQASLGKPHPLSPQGIHNIVEARKSRKLSPEGLHRMRTARVGKRHSEESREKMSASRKGVPKSATHRRAIGEAGKGRKHSTESREKIRLARLGKKHTPEAKHRMSISRMGVPKSVEHKEKIRLALLASWESRRV